MKNLKKILASVLVLSLLTGFSASAVSFASEGPENADEWVAFCNKDFFDDFPDLCDPDYEYPSEEGKFDLDWHPEVEERTESSSQTVFESDEQMLRHRGAEHEQVEGNVSLQYDDSSDDINSRGDGTNYNAGSCCNCFTCTIQ